MLSRPSNRCRRSSGGALGALAAAALVIAGCASGGGPEVPPTDPLLERERPFLPSPLEGYPLTLPATEERALEAAHGGLFAAGGGARAGALARDLLAADPGLHPASLLLAQVAFLDRDFDTALDLARPLLAELPDYRAAGLLVARAAEATGDLPEAYAAYRGLAASSELARRKRDELEARAIEIVSHRVDDALARNRVDDAVSGLEQLSEWAPESDAALEAQRKIGAATGDQPSELGAVRTLTARRPDDLELRERHADLELAAGEASTGLRILQELSAAAPDDRRLADKLARAKFRWRLVLLPPRARRLVELGELTRGDFAVMLYWLFPSVRYSVAGSATIASDVLDHPAREEIVRVANLGLMRVDPTVHRFDPDAPLYRRTALAALLRLLDREEPRVACLGPSAGGSWLSTERVCTFASRCGLIDEPAECFASAAVSGNAAADMSRRALARLGLE